MMEVDNDKIRQEKSEDARTEAKGKDGLLRRGLLSKEEATQGS